MKKKKKMTENSILHDVVYIPRYKPPPHNNNVYKRSPFTLCHCRGEFNINDAHTRAREPVHNNNNNIILQSPKNE